MHYKRKLTEEPIVDLVPTVDKLLDIKTETPEIYEEEEKEDGGGTKEQSD
jgi:hypothetical protein